MFLKYIIIRLIIILVLFFIASAEVPKINDPGSNTLTSGNPAVVKDKIIIATKNGNKVEWRHIILRGNNNQIGLALGQIAQKDYGIHSLSRYTDPTYGKARQAHMERNYPAMRESILSEFRNGDIPRSRVSDLGDWYR